MRIEEYQYHKSFNPKVWTNDELRLDVNYKLLNIAFKFIESLDLPDLKIYDVVLTGSMSNYNWTEYSDFDVHVLVDYNAVGCGVATTLFAAKKDLWNTQHNIQINDYDVELYVEDINNPTISKGVYSLLKSTWIRKPDYNPPDIDDAAVQAKIHELSRNIDSLVNDEVTDIDQYTALWDKVKKLRKSGLAKNGEFGVENLTFKELRNLGYIAKLSNAKRELEDRLLVTL